MTDDRYAYIPTTITTEIVKENHALYDTEDTQNAFHHYPSTDAFSSPKLLSSTLSSATSPLSQPTSSSYPMIINNAPLVPGGIRQLSKQIMADSTNPSLAQHDIICLKYSYAKHFHRKRIHEPKLLAELLDILHESRPCLRSLRLQGPFPRNAADVKRILVELTARPVKEHQDDTADDSIMEEHSLEGRDDQEDSSRVRSNGQRNRNEQVDHPEDTTAAIESVTPKLQEVMLAVPDDSRIPILPQFRDLIQGNPQLERLRLESFDLSDAFHYLDPDTKMPMTSVSNLLNALKDSSSNFPSGKGLRQLHLGGCCIQDKGLWDLVKGLNYLKNLSSFHIPRSTSLSYVSLLTMASLLQLNTKLQLLDLTGNKSLFAHVAPNTRSRTMADAIVMGTDVADWEDDTDDETKEQILACENAYTQFLRSLKNNSTLVELHLNYCGLNDNAFKFLLCAIEDNRKLAVLNLNHNEITRKIGLEEHLADILPSLKGLLHLSLEGLVRRRNHHHHHRNDDDDGQYKDVTSADLLVAQGGEASDVSALFSWERKFLQAMEYNSSLGSLILDDDLFHNNKVMFREIQKILERNMEWQRDQKFEQQLLLGIPTGAGISSSKITIQNAMNAFSRWM